MPSMDTASLSSAASGSSSITIDGVDICHIKRDDLRRHIAMVLQDTATLAILRSCLWP